MRGVHWCRWPGCTKTRCITYYCKAHHTIKYWAIERWGAGLRTVAEIRALPEPWVLDARPYWSPGGTGLL